MNNITLNWSAEDRVRIDKLIGLLEGLTDPVRVLPASNAQIPGQVTIAELLNESTIGQVADTATETPQEASQEVVEEQAPTEPAKAQDEPQEAKTEAPAPTVTKQDILQKVIALCGAGKKAEAKDIITTYADSVSDLPNSALVEVWDKLTALEG